MLEKQRFLLVLATLGALLDALRLLLGHSWVPLGRSGVLFAAFVRLLAILGALLVALGSSEGPLGAS